MQVHTSVVFAKETYYNFYNYPRIRNIAGDIKLQGKPKKEKKE